tara:strand:- start:499 stop:927 length:429 start_codon:yes stop_codon:yes gene_type:complete
VLNLKIKFDFNSVKIISLFQSIARVDVKDFFDLNSVYVFIVQKGQIGKAIGKNSSNVKTLENKLKKKIRIIEFDENIDRFIRNIVYPSKLSEVSFDEENKVLTISGIDNKTRGYLIGRSASNLRNNEFILKRHYDVSELKVS